ncbi:MAG: tetratricopeptide (TPR) repeat protein [Myxococcota bacterium]|jgi:tetratricopeptide (TPR) repeat protein
MAAMSVCVSISVRSFQTFSAAALALAALVLLSGCATDVTLRRIAHYPEVGVARHLPEHARVHRRSGRRQHGKATAPGHAPAAAKGPIAWEHSGLASAQGKALKLGRPLLVYVYTTWCGPCKRLKRDTFPNPKVSQLLNHQLVPFKLDGDTPAGKQFRRKYGVNSFPTMLFFRADGGEIDRMFGFQGPSRFAKVVDDMIHDRNTVGDFRRQLAANPKAVAVRHRLGLQLALRGDVAEAQKELEKVIALDPKDKQGHGARALYELGRYVHNMKRRDIKAALATYDQLLQRFPRNKSTRLAALDMASLHMRQKHPESALKVLDRLVSLNKKDPQPKLDAAWFLIRNNLDAKRAVKWAKSATKLRQDGWPWSTLGAAYAKQGNRKRQISALKQAVKRSPGNARYVRELQKAEAAR